MEKEFVTYSIAKKLKELGFKDFCTINNYFFDPEEPSHTLQKNFYGQHSGNCSENYLNRIIRAPLWQQAIDWLREKHKIVVDPRIHFSASTKPVFFACVFKDGKKGWEDKMKNDNHFTYEQAREAAINKALEIIEKAQET